MTINETESDHIMRVVKSVLAILLSSFLLFSSSCSAIEQAYLDTFSTFQDDVDYRQRILEDVQERLRLRAEQTGDFSDQLIASSKLLDLSLIHEKAYNQLLSEQELKALIEELSEYEKSHNLLSQPDLLSEAQEMLEAIYPGGNLKIYETAYFALDYMVVSLYDPANENEANRFVYHLKDKAWSKPQPIKLNDATQGWFFAEMSDLDFSVLSTIYSDALNFAADQGLPLTAVNAVQLRPYRDKALEFHVRLDTGRSTITLIYDKNGKIIRTEEN